MDDQQLLFAVGLALYGARWHTDIARDLDVSERAVRNWRNGAPIPAGVWQDIAGLIRARRAEMDTLLPLILDRS